MHGWSGNTHPFTIPHHLRAFFKQKYPNTVYIASLNARETRLTQQQGMHEEYR